jgi:four helix bundle protein
MRQSYRELRVWQLAMTVVREVYLATKRFPYDERDGLRSQMRRAAVSVPSNIAEGKGRSNRDFSRYLMVARGSNWELQTQLEITRDLGYLQPDAANRLILQAEDVSKMLNGMLAAFSTRQPAAS